MQPENPDRLSVLVDGQSGIFTTCTEFVDNCEGLKIRDAAQEAPIADIFKVHDFNYIMKVIQHVKTMSGSKNRVIRQFDGQDTASSEKTWLAT
jgi:hypothetical protein